jgi:hypothetical protein
MARVRLAGVIVQVEAFADDGEDLEPIQVQPIRTSVAEFKNIDLTEIAKMLQAQYDEKHPNGDSPGDSGFQ